MRRPDDFQARMDKQDKEFHKFMRNMMLTVLGCAVYFIITIFLCLAAIMDPDLSDTEQWLWCIPAVLWGPILVCLVILFLMFIAS